ncbi:MAG TPA: FAD-dependent oxidoreductase, partial [Geobacteraceae bacterium]|nr:FAD-dependent oxidoreductase [Geobacteraceae bacterium]
DLANSGYKVYLVESSPTIGGKMAQLDKTFPTGDCATCIISPKLVECARNLNIEIITLAQVEAMTGKAGDFTVRLRQKARYVDTGKCNACGDCEKACPVSVPDEFNRGLARTTAIRKVTAQAVPNAHVIFKRERPPCVSACPMAQNAQAYVALIARGKFTEAAEIIKKDNPLPLICGYVCHRPCESECQQGRYGDPVSIRALKKAALEFAEPSDSEEKHEEAVPLRPEKIAIIGSGPAGLGAADYLARRGYGVTIFEALPVPGGMMRAGIPPFRLPREVIDSQIRDILDLGVELKLNSQVGKDLTVDGLLENGYSAVFAAVGAQKSAVLDVPGEELEGVRPGIEFIRRVNLGEEVRIGGRVAVIGGGNAAMDIARTALRLGAGEVTVVYRRTRREMPADPVEIEEAAAEGVRFVFLTNPKRFIEKDGRLAGMECLKMRLSDDRDASGRRRPVPVEGSEHVLDFDDVIVAIGQLPDMSFARETQIATNRRGMLGVDPVTFATGKAGVFAGGDVVAGAGTLSEAVAAGRRAAESIDRYINGQDMAAGRSADGRVWTEERHSRLESLQLREKRRKSRRIPAEPGAGYSAERAMAEAERCLACGLCCECMECVKACLAKAIDHEMQDTMREVRVGAVVLAPGFEEFEARLRGEYGFGRYDNVVTNVQFERMLSAGGPFGGHLQRPSDGGEPKKIAFIQCVGSRDAASGHPYCSSVCCMAAIKEAVVAREHVPGLEVAVFYTDIRAYGKDFDRYYERARTVGVRFERSMVSRVVEMPGAGTLRLSYIMDLAPVDEEFDLVILSTGLRPSDEALSTARAVGAELNECGFCRTDEFAAVSTTRNGVYVAGAFQDPKDIPETVTQASAAAAMAMELLAPARGTLVTEKVYPPERDVTDEPPRIGVFICHCGINISSVVDVEKVVEAARTMPYVVFAENQVYACADNTQDHIREVIGEHGLNRLIVASCTPRTHEALFRDTARECGLNPFLVDMANIRDQASWVHSANPQGATEKAVDLVRMATARAARLFPLMTERLPVVQEALVIGGGPSGMTTALSLAGQGFPVHLVEKADRLGGRLGPGLLRDSLSESVAGHPLIRVYRSSQVTGISGHIGNFSSELKTPDGVVTLAHGVMVVATGGVEYKPVEYLYGNDPRVFTQRGLETGLADGSITLSEQPNIAMIQCVGSRNEERPFCGRSCCTDAVKNAIRIKELRPDANVLVLYRDMRTYGSNELFYQKAREAGVIFMRYELENPPEVSGGDRLRIRFTDPSLAMAMNLELDYLVLSTGTSPALDNEKLSELAKIPLNSDGFFLEAHVKLRPVDFASEGIFLCGSAHSPKSTAENMQQARAAAGRAATVLSRSTMVVGGQVSRVDVRKCVSCLTCVRVCPYGAPAVSLANGKNRVEIQAARCMGCGSCAAECPAGAIELRHFTDRQVLAAIEALLEVAV